MPQQMDEAYARAEFYWGREPNGLCRQVCELIPPESARGGRLIDLGAGEGRDAVRFAAHGFTVTAVDVSLPGLEKATRWAQEEGLPLETVQASILDYRIPRGCAVVYASGTLHYLPPERRVAVLAQYKDATAPHGVHAFNAFVEKPFIPAPPDYARDEYFFRSGELLGTYWDWEILFCHEEIFPYRSGGVPHRHALNTLIARKTA